MVSKSGDINLLFGFLFIYSDIRLSNCFEGRSLIDLSYPFDQKFTPSHPAVLKFDLRLVKQGYLESGKWYYENDIFTSEHMGTHIDAPIHISEGHESVDEIALNKLYRVPGVMIDLKNKIKGNKKYIIKAEDIKSWIKENGDIPDGSVVLFRTGWEEKVSNPKEYRGIDAYGRTNFPGLGESAAKFLVSYKNHSDQMKGIIGVGIDTLSIDSDSDSSAATLTAHRTILEEGLFVLENLANLDKLPLIGFTLTMLPMKIKGGSGAPTRILAEINGTAYLSPQSSTSSRITPSQASTTFYVALLMSSSFFSYKLLSG